MSFRHILAITRKEFNHILRDRSTMILVVFTPLVMLLLMAYALTVELQHIPIAILDYDRSATSRDFVQQIVSGNGLDLYAQVGSIAEIEDLLMHGDVKAALVIDPNFSRDLLAMRGMPMQVIIDGTEPESGGFAVEHIASRAEEFANKALSTQIQMMGFSADALNPLDLRIRTWYNPGLKPRNDLIPGLISMVLGMPALSVALALAHEREHGTMEQLMATPIGRGELLIGKMIPYIVAGLVNVVILPLLAISWFNVPFNGSFPLFFALSALFMFAVLSMGIIIGVFMKSQAAAMGVSFLMIFFPGFFLTGIFFPIVSMPEIMRLESLGMPGTHYATITRGIFLPGVGMEILWPYAVMLVLLGFSFTGIASLFFKKKLG